MPTYAKSPSPDTPSGKRSNSLVSLSNVRSLVGPRTLSDISTISPLLRSTPTWLLTVWRFFLPEYHLTASSRLFGRCTGCSNVSITTPSSGISESNSSRVRRCLRPGSGILIWSLPPFASRGISLLTHRDTVESETPNRKPSTSLVGYWRSHTTVFWRLWRTPREKWGPAPVARWRTRPSLVREWRACSAATYKGITSFTNCSNSPTRSPVRDRNTVGYCCRLWYLAIMSAVYPILY